VKKKPWAVCVECELRIRGHEDFYVHLRACTEQQLALAANDERVAVLNPHNAFGRRDELDSDEEELGTDDEDDDVVVARPDAVTFKCLDCGKPFPTYRTFLVHAGPAQRTAGEVKRVRKVLASSKEQ
jgi:hypothetical protein